MARPKKVKTEQEFTESKQGSATVYEPVVSLTEAEERALHKEKPSSPEGTLEGKELPATPKVSLPKMSTKELTTQRFASEVQERVFKRQEAARLAKEKRRTDILAQAKEASKSIQTVFVPYKDRNGDIVPALVLGVEDTPKKDKGGPVLDENNEPVMEAKLKVYVFSNIDEPRKTLYSFEEGVK